MTDTDIHSCGYYCDRPLCIKAQRDELREKLFAKEWVGLTNEELNDCLVEADPCESLAEPEARQLMEEVQAKIKEKNT